LGSPKLSCLQALHIEEADYNLLLKYFSALVFFKEAEEANLITENQG